MRSNISMLFCSSMKEASVEEARVNADRAEIRKQIKSGRTPLNSIPRDENMVVNGKFDSTGHGTDEYRDLWVEHDRAWTNLLSDPPPLIMYDSIPFPPCDSDVLEFTGRLNSLRDPKAAYRLACRRFHPDKFLQRCGSSLDEPDAVHVVSRLTEITQSINAQWERRKRRFRSASEPPSN